MNVTPLIDVLLVLIIIFLVITPIKSKGLDTAAPEQGEGTAAPSQDIVIEIAADRSLSLNSQRLAMDELGARLVDLWKQGANRVIFVKGDHGLYFEDVAHVIDVAKGAGYVRVALMP